KKIDEDICRWIVEFLLRHPIADYDKIEKVINVIPNVKNNPKIRKTLLLRSIQADISDASVSETILEKLETIAALDRQENIPTTYSMKAAYCAVAVECAVKYLRVSACGKGKYFDAVKKIWRNKIGTLEESDESGLLSDELMKWREVIEEAVLDVKISEKLLEKNTRNDALMGVMAYLGEAWAISGPPFLELATRVMKKKLKETGNDSVPEGPGDAPMSDSVQEMENDSVPVGPGDETVSHRGAKIAEYVESEGEDDGSKNDLPSSPQVSKVQEVLKASPLELQALVKDPLPDALGMAENDKEATNLPNPTGTGSVEEPVETEGRNQPVGHQNNLPEPCIMGSNRAVRNYEAFQRDGDDSIEGSPGETSNHPSRTHLPSPKRKVVSPLQMYELPKVAKRRTVKRWSLEEEDALRKAVKDFGSGNWKVILDHNRDLFPERTQVDLKDKWRNMARCGVDAW
ncbi:Myb_DNA-binding domain-containing protein, partial [Cephalotus follicularis]